MMCSCRPYWVKLPEPELPTHCLPGGEPAAVSEVCTRRCCRGRCRCRKMGTNSSRRTARESLPASPTYSQPVDNWPLPLEIVRAATRSTGCPAANGADREKTSVVGPADLREDPRAGVAQVLRVGRRQLAAAAEAVCALVADVVAEIEIAEAVDPALLRETPVLPLATYSPDAAERLLSVICTNPLPALLPRERLLQSGGGEGDGRGPAVDDPCVVGTGRTRDLAPVCSI